MAREEKSKTHLRVTLREFQDGLALNSRRNIKGIAHINFCGPSGEVLIAVENLKYLGSAPNGRPYYYEGWLILRNGKRVGMGPISVDSKGCGKSFWRLNTEDINLKDVEAKQIVAVAITMEVLNEQPLGKTYALLGELYNNEGDHNEESLMPSLAKETGQPAENMHNSIISAMEIMRQAIRASTLAAKPPYNWHRVQVPGSAGYMPLLFGYQLGDKGIERLAFGVPGLSKQPPSQSEVGEWYPLGPEAVHGHWVYFREPHVAI